MGESFNCLTILVTNQCPLKCAHCGPRSGPNATGALSNEDIEPLLDEAVRRKCKLVNFSGGEPFLLGKILVQMIRSTASRRLLSRITTGAFWARTPTVAGARLTALAEAGLKQLFISCGDTHAKYVPVQNVVNASASARTLGVQVFLSITTSRISSIRPDTIRAAFEAAGVPIPPVFTSPVIPFGRASENFSNDHLLLRDVNELVGGCPSLSQHPTVHPDGTITGCAVVFGKDCPALGHGNIFENSFAAVIDRMNSHPLVAWIHHLGVVSLKELVERNSQIRFKEQYVNICHLCGDILSNRAALACLSELGLNPPGTSGARLSDSPLKIIGQD